MKRNILLAAAFALFIIFFQACNDGSDTTATTSDTTHHDDASAAEEHPHDASANAEHGNMVKKMMDDMSAVKMTGDFDLDFANMMIPHHQSAVDIAQSYLPKSKDDKIKGMAQHIIETQKKEIEEFKTMIANYKPAEKKESSTGAGHAGGEHNELMETMNKMMDKMKGMEMTGNHDKDFVMMMVPHHQSAVEMANNELSHGKKFEIKKMAQKIIEDQNKEIKEFEDWLGGNK